MLKLVILKSIEKVFNSGVIKSIRNFLFKIIKSNWKES